MPRIGGVQGWRTGFLQVLFTLLRLPGWEETTGQCGYRFPHCHLNNTAVLWPCMPLYRRCMGCSGIRAQRKQRAYKKAGSGQMGRGYPEGMPHNIFSAKRRLFYLGKLGVFNLIKLDFQNLRKLEVCERVSIRPCPDTEAAPLRVAAAGTVSVPVHPGCDGHRQRRRRRE